MEWFIKLYLTECILTVILKLRKESDRYEKVFHLIVYCYLYYNPNGFDGSFGVNGGTGCLNAVKYAQADKGISPINGEATAALVKALCS